MAKLDSAELTTEPAQEIRITTDIPLPPGGGSWIWDGKEWQPTLEPETAPIASE